MGIISQEEDVLKLVHPGRYVEIHKEPISAAEVLKKNPRHSITRPDVFHYPWIVVKPEAVLKPGKVFLIVPNCTIYGLLKTYREEHHQHSPPQSQLSKNVVHSPRQSQLSKNVVQSRNSPEKSVRMTPRPMNRQRWFKQSLCIGTTFEKQDSDKEIRAWKLAGKSVGRTPKRLNQQQPFKPSRSITSCIGTASQEHNFDKRIIKQAKNESWPKLVSMNKNPFLELEDKPEEDSTSEIRTSHLKERHFVNINNSAEFPRKNDSELEFNCMEKVNTLKSCLRKPDSVRKFLLLRVSFMLPVDDDEKLRAVNASRIEVTNNDSSSSSDFFCSYYKPRSYMD